MKVCETERLNLRWISTDDAEFILGLLNEPSWLHFIGDRGVRTLEDAHNYILNGPVAMYGRLGFGLYLVELKESGLPLGMCGLPRYTPRSKRLGTMAFPYQNTWSGREVYFLFPSDRSGDERR